MQQNYATLLSLAIIFPLACANSDAGDLADNSSRPLSAQTEARTYVFECSDGYNFVARIEGKHAWLFLPNQTLSLPHVAAGSGAEYSDGTTTFWSKGDQAFVEVAAEVHRECKNNRARAIWEHARLSGADFRAVGNEPGWNLEISTGRKSIFVGDYGSIRYEFTIPEPTVDEAARTTRYELNADGHALVIVIEGHPCQDSMSGEPFTTTVTVILDDRRYRGCGRALH